MKRCEKCDAKVLFGEPDPCLTLLPGVSHACCGHGTKEPYVVIGGKPDEPCCVLGNRGVTLRGESAGTFFALLRGGEWHEGGGTFVTRDIECPMP